MRFYLFLAMLIHGAFTGLSAQNKNERNADLAYSGGHYKASFLLAEEELNQNPGNERALWMLLQSGMKIFENTDSLFNAHAKEVQAAKSNAVHYTVLYHHLKAGRIETAEAGIGSFDSTKNGLLYEAMLHCHIAILQKNADRLLQNARTVMLQSHTPENFDYLTEILNKWIDENGRESLLNHSFLKENDLGYLFIKGVITEDSKARYQVFNNMFKRYLKNLDFTLLSPMAEQILYSSMREKDKKFFNQYRYELVSTDEPVSRISALRMSALIGRSFDDMDLEGLGIFEKGVQFNSPKWSYRLFNYFDTNEIVTYTAAYQKLSGETAWDPEEPFTALYLIQKHLANKYSQAEASMMDALFRMLMSINYWQESWGHNAFLAWSQTVCYKHYLQYVDLQKYLKSIPKAYYPELHKEAVSFDEVSEMGKMNTGLLKSLFCEWIRAGRSMAVLGLAEAVLPVLKNSGNENMALWLGKVQENLNGLLELPTYPDYLFALDERKYLEEVIRETTDSETKYAYETLLKFY